MFTMLLVALYYLFADTLLMSQVLYYRYKTNGTIFEEESNIDTNTTTISTTTTNEQSPLLSSNNNNNNNNNNTKPKYHHKQSEQTKWTVRLFFIASIFLWTFLLLGSATYFFWPWAKDKVDLSQWHFVSQFFGWASAILYCCSRIPQIMQNFRNESVEGLSLVMFIFSVVGNLTYCVSIFAKSMDRTFLLINFPWLLGSGGTLFFDFTIFFQFYTYRHHSDSL
ncbi:unnamed protein product [Cunninghamella echinulata]